MKRDGASILDVVANHPRSPLTFIGFVQTALWEMNRRRQIQEHDCPARWQVAHLGGRMFRGRSPNPSL
jgi:hypothetical protein